MELCFLAPFLGRVPKTRQAYKINRNSSVNSRHYAKHFTTLRCPGSWCDFHFTNVEIMHRETKAHNVHLEPKTIHSAIPCQVKAFLKAKL